ncbi:MAG: beta-N-acetylhexosaminidase [Bacteroidaceae bacterium]|nr:beta-N-acetylhexosaminidase [Bacteroidaceae bacterium]
MITRCYMAFAALSLSLAAPAQVDYQVVPLPQKIELDGSGRTTLLIKGQTVEYPEGNAQMKRNAEFAQEFLGLKPQEAQTPIKAAGKRKQSRTPLRAPVSLTLGLQSENPDAFVITVGQQGVTIQGASESGVFHGIQTLRKSIAAEQGDTIALPWATVASEPRFQYRGAMLDCARHFFQVSFIKKFLDILALHGLNQFHWHLTDDQGWRPEIKALPELEKASSRSCTVIGRNVGLHDMQNPICDDTPVQGFYTQDELREVVAYAAERYINIIPEIDLPGHMVAALSVYPELGCTGGPYPIRPYYTIDPDVLCAGNPKTLEFIKTVLGEVCDVFPSKFIHIGGDECPRVNWKACQKCQALMKQMGFQKEAQLQSYINAEVGDFLSARGRELIGWDEILEGGLSENATVMSWRGYEGGIAAARQRHRVIMTPTSHCYFDYYQLGNQDTQPLAIGGYLPLSLVYKMEPVPGELSEEEKKYILGAQCNLWSEDMVSPDHVMYMLLPRLAALSEVQWMQPAQKDFGQFTGRLDNLLRLYRREGYKYCTTYE